MPLIDHTLFYGEINIPNIDKLEVSEELTHFITMYEEKFLISLLGYRLSKAFKAGLAQDPVEQKWIDLLAGAEYTYNDELFKWNGLVNSAVLASQTIIGYNYKSPILLKVGETRHGILIQPDTSLVTVEDWIGWEILPEEDGVGSLKKNEEYSYDKTTGTWVMLTRDFDEGVYYHVAFELKNVLDVALTTTTAKESMIANYVYHHWTNNKVTTTAGIGEVINKPENAVNASSIHKSVRAWNKMVDQVHSLRHFLFHSAHDYSLFDTSIHTGNYSLYHYNNPYGI
jgi:hypothetical protein